MTITAHSREKSHAIIFGPGITHCPMLHQDFTKALSDQLSRKWDVFNFHESRVEAKIKNCRTLEQLAEACELEPIDMFEQAKEFVNDTINAASDDQEKLIILLYSSDCMLAPFIQYLLNLLGKDVIFILIDGVPLTVAQQQSNQQILLNFSRIIIRVSKLLHYPVNDLDEQAVKAKIIELDTTNMNAALKQLFEFTLPDFPNMTKINELKSVYQDFACFPLTILPLILANTQSLLTSKYTSENSAKLEQALVISTQSTCSEYKQDSTLGWDKLMQSEGVEVLHLSSLNHFNVIQTKHDKGPMLDEYEAVIQAILRNLPSSAIAASPMATPLKGDTSPPRMSLHTHTPPPSPLRRGTKRRAEKKPDQSADAEAPAIPETPTRPKKRIATQADTPTKDCKDVVDEFVSRMPLDKHFWTQLINARNELCTSPIVLSGNSSSFFTLGKKTPQKPGGKSHGIHSSTRSITGARA